MFLEITTNGCFCEILAGVVFAVVAAVVVVVWFGLVFHSSCFYQLKHHSQLWKICQTFDSELSSNINRGREQSQQKNITKNFGRVPTIMGPFSED